MTEGLEAIVTDGVASRLPRLFDYVKSAYNEDEVKWLLVLRGIDSAHNFSYNEACHRLAIVVDQAIIRGHNVKAALLKDRPGRAADIDKLFTEFGQMKTPE